MVVLNDCIVELVRPVDIGRVHNEAGPVQHLALKVKDLEKVMSELTVKGLKFSELEVIPDFCKGMRHAFIYGPSNERIELAEALTCDIVN